MLASLLARYHDLGERDADRHGAWAAALRELRDDPAAAGSNPRRLGEYVRRLPEEQRFEALQDLIAEDLRLAWQSGHGPTLDSYFAGLGAQFAGLRSAGSAPAALVEDEFLARYQLPHGDTPAVGEYRRRFPGREDIAGSLAMRFMDGGRYVKLHKRGLGAMGEVWEACDLHLRRLVAIKEPRPGLANKADALRRFEREAMVTAGLEHPAIVGVHEYRRAAGFVPFYVMRLVRGRTLSERIREFHRPPSGSAPLDQRLLWEQLLQSLATVADAISYAHGCGVLHRDLKPGNIILGDFGEVVVLDWGMACRFSAPEAAAACAPDAVKPVEEVIVGTPDYMPPEQAGGQAEVRSDVFGLGAILYEMLTGRPPHGWVGGAWPADWSRQVREARFEPPRRVQPAMPRPLEAICMKALAREPERRHRTAAEFARDLRCFAAGQPVSAMPPTALTRAWRRLKRAS